MASTFTVQWTRKEYETAFKKLYVPWWRRSQRRSILAGLLIASFGLWVLTGALYLEYWIASHHMEVWQALLLTWVISLVFVAAATSNLSKEINQGWSALEKVGPVVYELTDEQLITRLPSGSFTRMPWHTLELLAENRQGLLLNRKDYVQLVMVPHTVGEAAIAELRARLGSINPATAD